MATVNRKMIDCRDHPGSHCTLRISGTEDEVMKAAMEHGITSHGFKDTPEFRNDLRKYIKEEREEKNVNVGQQPSGTKVA